MKSNDEAVSCFLNGYNCAQAILSTYCERLGLERDLAFKITTAFGGGMARQGETCGAVTGALMVIGLKQGRIEGDDKQVTEQTYEKTIEFFKQFKKFHGSIKCKDLLESDISTPEGRKDAIVRDLFNEKCPEFVRSAAKILDNII